MQYKFENRRDQCLGTSCPQSSPCSARKTWCSINEPWTQCISDQSGFPFSVAKDAENIWILCFDFRSYGPPPWDAYIRHWHWHLFLDPMLTSRTAVSGEVFWATLWVRTLRAAALRLEWNPTWQGTTCCWRMAVPPRSTAAWSPKMASNEANTYPPENERISLQKGAFWKDISFSNHQFSGDMLVFRGDSSFLNVDRHFLPTNHLEYISWLL